MIDNTQAKLDKLARIEAANRARSKKYLDKMKTQGKRQLSIILDAATIDTLIRLKSESMAAGKRLMYGDIITNAINNYVNIDKTAIKKNVIENIKSDITLNKIELAKILQEIPPGQWKKESDILNKRGIKTAKGLPWTPGNLLYACKKFKK